jgi:tetratricopeptide (TPR) repeat protein
MLNVEGVPSPHESVDTPSKIVLPDVPAELRDRRVAAWPEPLVIDSYLPTEPSAYPAFLDRRVYQGSSGKVYPLPFHERIAQEKAAHEWQALHLENEWVRLVILPELGGRIHIGYDKVADYDFFYRNNVIKPALVGLAGPWVSGGVEFNWPQHHRPATFLPTDWEIEEESDGSVTVWCSDHDPMNRMKGMHGIRLRPDSSVIEARVRLYNRTDETQTFLWWANVAAAVGDDYQSFFPTDVRYVADHAKRAVATFPQVDGSYYGVDYPARVTADRPDGDRLDWYRNIPVPTSYMVTATSDDFFGGYDHGREAGFVHWADRSFAPGKKQWTWGNAPFGWAWDANLTDGDGPYVELMAGVYTDNQPDFSWIAPGETKTFSQYWYPIQKIGPAQQANLDVAVRVEVSGTTAHVAVAATRAFAGARIALGGHEVTADLAPGKPFSGSFEVEVDGDQELTIEHDGTVLLRWRSDRPGAEAPVAATEPPQPADIDSTDELYLTGQYLEQYRHATRHPEPYWLEALRRDPGDSRSHVALARSRTRAGEFDEAEQHLRSAIARLTTRVPNPADGEAHYRLGIVLARLGRTQEAIEALGKSQWNSAWRVPAGFALGRLHAAAGRLDESERVLREVHAIDAQHSQASALLAAVLRARGSAKDVAEAAQIVDAILAADRLDQWARDLAGLQLTADAPTLLDVALEYAAAGFDDDALRLLEKTVEAARATALGQVQVAPLALYHAAALHDRAGRPAEAAAARAQAGAADLTNSLPSRLDDIAALEAAGSDDVAAALLLGSWYYDKGRSADAVDAWTGAAGSTDPLSATIAHRNLGIAQYNWSRDRSAALRHFEAARSLAPDDAKILFEYDQLLARTGRVDRLPLLEANLHLVGQRDDLTVEYVRLLVSAGRAEEARGVLLARRFQPWEGGEGLVLAAWDATMTALYALSPAAEEALGFIEAALNPPATLGEARHPLANAADLHLLLGDAKQRLGDDDGAKEAWRTAASFTGDFLDMSTQPFSAQTAYSIRALRALGEQDAAEDLTGRLARYVDELAATPAKVNYFATSLPTTLLFHDDPQEERDARVAVLRRQLAALTSSSGEHAALAAQG